jgi:hypothetical protein
MRCSGAATVQRNEIGIVESWNPRRVQCMAIGVCTTVRAAPEQGCGGRVWLAPLRPARSCTWFFST